VRQGLIYVVATISRLVASITLFLLIAHYFGLLFIGRYQVLVCVLFLITSICVLVGLKPSPSTGMQGPKKNLGLVSKFVYGIVLGIGLFVAMYIRIIQQ
jgi:hypothetical protein